MDSEARKCPKCGEAIPEEAPQGLCPKCLFAQASLPTETGAAQAHKPTPPALAELAAAFPQLEILELIGQGGMGFVYQARQPKLERLVALKILPQSLAVDPAFADRFAREGRLLARLSHPNIVAIHDFGQANGFFYLLMEYVDGVNLRQAMQAGRFTPEQALTVVPKICDALQYAHNEGVLHRDIKPENILLDTKGRIKIADFGIAKMLGEGELRAPLTQSGGTLGTPHYMAPEQIERPASVDHRADIYSLGVVFYEMLTGELPLGKFQPPSKKVQVDVRLDDVVLHALEKEPERRYQQVSEVKTAVDTLRAPAQAAAAPSGARASSEYSGPTPLPGKRYALKAGAAVFLVVTILAVLWTFLQSAEYRSTARIKITQVSLPDAGAQTVYDPNFVQNQKERIRAVSRVVVQKLTLQERWGRRYNDNTSLTPDEANQLLQRAIEINPIPNTEFVEIAGWSKLPKESAELANAMAQEYQKYCEDEFENALHQRNAPQKLMRPFLHLCTVELADLAMAPRHPAKPNRPLNIFLGIVIGGLLGLFTAGMTALVAAFRRRAAEPAPLQDRFWRRFAVAVALVLLAMIMVPVLLTLLAIVLPELSHPRAKTSQKIVSLPSSSQKAGGSMQAPSPEANPGPSLLDTNFYIGNYYFPRGDAIRIVSVQRSNQTLRVRGTFDLVSADAASLKLYVTSRETSAEHEDPRQGLFILKGKGAFDLFHPHVPVGLPHVVMYPTNFGDAFGDLYFGNKEESEAEKSIVFHSKP